MTAKELLENRIAWIEGQKQLELKRKFNSNFKKYLSFLLIGAIYFFRIQLINCLISFSG